MIMMLMLMMVMMTTMMMMMTTMIFDSVKLDAIANFCEQIKWSCK